MYYFFPHRTQKAVPYQISEVLLNLYISFILLLLPFVLGPLACLPAELIWNYGSYRQVLGLLGWEISPVAVSLLTQDNTNRKNADVHLCLGWDSNAGSECLSSRRHFVLCTARPLLSTIISVSVFALLLLSFFL
jgi:hypothetical protein